MKKMKVSYMQYWCIMKFCFGEASCVVLYRAGKSPMEGHQDDQVIRHLFSEETVRELGLFTLEKMPKGAHINLYKYLKGVCKEDGVRLFSVVPGQEAISINWNRGFSLFLFFWTSGSNSFLYGWWSTGIGCTERLWSFFLGGVQKPSGHGHGHPFLLGLQSSFPKSAIFPRV